MKRMNLLPPELRPRMGGRQGSSWIVIGALAAAVVAMLVYGFVISRVHADEDRLASLQQEAQLAQADADRLSPYAEFANMKETRAESVRTVAEQRFNYEKLTDELAQILPSNVWVNKLDVSPASPSAEEKSQGADNPGASHDPRAPILQIGGCAPSQPVVADSLDRLRALTGATGVALGSSGREGLSPGTSSAPSGGDKPYLVKSTSSSGGCGEGGRPRYSFDATVTLTAPSADPENPGS